MTTVTIERPNAMTRGWRVYGTYVGRLGRYVFVERWLEDGRKADEYARMLLDKYKADHLGRR